MKKLLKVSLSAVNILAFAVSQSAWADTPQIPSQTDPKTPSGFSIQVLKDREAVVKDKVEQIEDSFGRDRDTKAEMLTPKPKDPGFIDPVRPKWDNDDKGPLIVPIDTIDPPKQPHAPDGVGDDPKTPIVKNPGYVDPVRPVLVAYGKNGGRFFGSFRNNRNKREGRG